MRWLEPQQAIGCMSRLLVEDYIWEALDDCLHSLQGIYRLFKRIDLGEVQAFGVVRSDGELMGTVIGELTGSVFYGHFFMRRLRGADLRPIRDVLLATIRGRYVELGMEVTGFCGQVPETNRACQRLCRRLGAKDCGLGTAIFEHDGERVPCRDFYLEG